MTQTAETRALDQYDYFSQERREMLPFVPAQRARALEIGCGEGGFIGALTGVEESWGIESSSAAVIAKRHLTQVFHATFDEAEPKLPLGFFDVVICNDVIEHMPDHAGFFDRVAKFIAPGGMIIGSIPNVRFYINMLEYLVKKDWCYTDVGILDRTHLAFFTEKSLRNTLERHGYCILQIRGINSWWRMPGIVRHRAYRVIAYAMIAVTLGYFVDIKYLQFAFQATPRRA
jgi:2-polyprenyl-3-methyl-5-hydroxy-6-metoxy-1,4-benzoquinol methylase